MDPKRGVQQELGGGWIVLLFCYKMAGDQEQVNQMRSISKTRLKKKSFQSFVMGG